MLEPTQSLLEMHLERHNCLQQWKWKVSECNCGKFVLCFGGRHVSFEMTDFFFYYSQGSWGIGI